MSTIVINLNDTIASYDTIVVKLAKVGDVCLPIVNETRTNCYDAQIAKMICWAVVMVALIAAVAILLWKSIDTWYKNHELNFKAEKENIESIRKQKADLIDKYLDFLKEETKETISMDEFEKSIDEAKKGPICDLTEKLSAFFKSGKEKMVADPQKKAQYKLVLEYLIELSQKGELNNFSIQKIKELFNNIPSE